MQFEPDGLKLDFDDVLIRPKRSKLVSRSAVKLNRTFRALHSSRKWNGLPIIAANMDTVGTFKMAETLSDSWMATAIHKHYPLDSILSWIEANKHDEALFENSIFWSAGMDRKTPCEQLQKIQAKFPFAVRNICLDVANGYTEEFVDFVRRVRIGMPDTLIMAGNVVTKDMTEALLLAGADIVKIGIGPGSVCTTRKITGVGYPQLSAIIECADAAHGLDGLICADGGCRTPGDIAKAFGAGADFVMLGGMLAGHAECHASITAGGVEGKTMEFYGMSSERAMDIHHGGVNSYRASEGKAVQIPYRGPVTDTVQEILGGLRSTCTYTGSKSLKELSKRTTFVRVSAGRQYNDVFGK